MYDYFSRGFNTLSVVKHKKILIRWGPWYKIVSNGVHGLTCGSLGLFDMKTFGIFHNDNTSNW